MSASSYIDEALSRAVIGGVVRIWHWKDCAKLGSTEPPYRVWTVTTHDGKVHEYGIGEAKAFADAIYAAEQATAYAGSWTS